jgi:hypothetical protein
MSQTYVPAFTLEPEKRAAAPKPADGPRTPNFINDVAAGKVELPTIPRVVQQVLAALRDPDVDARKIGERCRRIRCSRPRCCAWRTRRSSAASARWRRSTPRWR